MTEPEVRQVVPTSVAETHPSELTSRLGPLATAQAIPMTETASNPDGYNPALVSYVSATVEDRRVTVPVLTRNKLASFARDRGFPNVEVDSKKFIEHVRALHPETDGIVGNYTFAGILRADRLRSLVVDISSGYLKTEFGKHELAFLRVCLACLKSGQAV